MSAVFIVISRAIGMVPAFDLPKKESHMLHRFHRKYLVATVAALLSALAVGGIAVAQGGGSTPAPTPPKAESSPAGETPGQESNAPENSATDPDNVQEGDQNETQDKADGPNEKADGPNDKADEANDNADEGAETGSSAPKN